MPLLSRPALDLPPPYSLVTLRELGDAHAHACRIAPEAGAGTLVWVGRFDLVEFAVVLEPEEPLGSARRAFFAGMSALADAVGTHAPPEKAVSFDWPGSLHLDGALIGGARVAWPEGCGETEVPDWLVLSAQIIAAHASGTEPGLLFATSLEEEGAEGAPVIESFARNLMLHLDRWADEGFAAVERAYLERLPKAKAGERRTIDAVGDLLVRAPLGDGDPERRALVPGLLAPAWYDPVRRGPRLR